MSGFGGV